MTSEHASTYEQLRVDQQSSLEMWLKKKSVLCDEVLQTLPTKNTNLSEQTIVLASAVLFDQPTVFGRTDLPPFTDALGNELVWLNHEAVPLKSLTASQLQRLIVAEKQKISQQITELKRDRQFFQSRINKDSAPHQESPAWQNPPPFEYILRWLTTAETTPTQQPIAEVAEQILTFVSKLRGADPDQLTVMHANEQRAFRKALTVTVGPHHLTFADLVGEQAVTTTFDTLLHARSLTDYQQAVEKAVATLCGSRVTTILLTLRLLPPATLAELDISDFLTQLDLEMIGNLDEYVRLTDHLTRLRNLTDTREQFQNSAAIFLLRQIEAGALSGSLARRVFEELQAGEQPEVLLFAYVESYVSSELALSSYSKKFQSRSVLRRIVQALVASSLLVSGATVGQETLVQTLDTAQQITSELGKLLFDIGASLQLNSVLGIDDPTQVKPPGPPKSQSLSSERARSIHERTANQSFNDTNRPITSSDLTHPVSDRIATEFRPSSVDPEGYLRQAKDIVWDLQGWDSLPEALYTNTFTTVNKDQLSFGGGLHLQSTDTGIEVPLLNIEEKNQLSNLVIGERSQLPVDGYQNGRMPWVEAPHPPGMDIVAGAVWVFQDGIYVGSYPVEVFFSPQTQDQQVRFGLTDKDIDWYRLNFSSLSLQVVYQYEPSTRQVQPEAHVETGTTIPFEVLDPDLQALITQLNTDPNLSDQDKFQQLLDWFHHYGRYSFNPIDDQWWYVNDAVNQGLLPATDQTNAFFGLFFGTYQERLGLTPDAPHEGAGECNRRNSAFWVAVEHVQLQEEWEFELQNMFVVGSSRYSADSQQVRGNTYHMRFQATNVRTRETVVLDATGALDTDDKTQETLSSASEVHESDQADTPSKPDTPFEERLYQPNPENMLYPTEYYSIPITPEMLVGDDGTWTRIDINRFGALWQLRNFSYDDHGANHPFFNPSTTLPIATVQFGDHLTLAFGSDQPTFQYTYIAKEIEIPTGQISYDIVFPSGTNTIPLIIDSTGNYGLAVDASSVRVTTSTGLLLPHRLEVSGTIPQIVVDLPAAELSGVSASVSYQVGQAGKYGITFDESDNLYFIDEVVAPRYVFFDEAYEKLRQLGLSDASARKIYLDYYLEKIESHVYPGGPDRSQDMRELGLSVQTLSLLDMFTHTARTFYMAGTIDFEYVLSYLDEYFPDLPTVWSENNSGYVPDFVQSISNEAGERLLKKFENGEPVTNRELLTQIMTLDPRNGSNNYLFSEFLGYLEFAVKVRAQDDIKEDQDAMHSVNRTREIATVQFCDQTYEQEADKVACFLRAPNNNQLSSEWTKHAISSILYPGRSYEYELALSPKFDELGAQERSLSRNYNLDHFSVFSELEGEYVPYVERQLWYNPHLEITLAQRQELFDKEKAAVQSWYLSETLRALSHGNPYTTTRFLGLFLPLAAAAYGIERSRAGRRRWTRYARKRNDRETLVKDLATKLNLDPSDPAIRLMMKRPHQQAKLMREPRATFTSQDRLAAEYAVQGLRSTGQNSSLFRLGQRLGRAENPWSSREVPPTYAVLMADIMNSGVIEYYTSLFSEEPLAISSIFSHAAAEGIGLRKASKKFKDNRLVLDSKTVPQWQHQLSQAITSELEAVQVIPEPAIIDQFVQMLTPVWQKVMTDWQVMHRKNVTLKT